MRQSAALARQYGVHLHTHLAETQDEEAFCLEKFGYRPVAYMEILDWVGPDVWFAHSVHVNRGGDRPVRPHRLRCGALPHLEYAPGIRDCAGARDAARRGEGRAGCGWLGQQRWLAPAGGSAPGDAAGAGERRIAWSIAHRLRCSRH